MAHTTNPHTDHALIAYLGETALSLLLPGTAFLAVILTVALFGKPANACDEVTLTANTTTHYTVTADPRTSETLSIPLADNLDYELDHVRTDPDAELGCDERTLDDERATLTWYECVVPVSEAPTL